MNPDFKLGTELALSLCRRAFLKGWHVAVDYREDPDDLQPMRGKDDMVKLREDIAACDEEDLVFYDLNKEYIGRVFVIYENGCDVVCDYTTSYHAEFDNMVNEFTMSCDSPAYLLLEGMEPK